MQVNKIEFIDNAWSTKACFGNYLPICGKVGKFVDRIAGVPYLRCSKSVLCLRVIVARIINAALSSSKLFTSRDSISTLQSDARVMTRTGPKNAASQH